MGFVAGERSLSSYHKWKLCKFGLCDLCCGPCAISRSASSPYIRARAVCTFTYIRAECKERKTEQKEIEEMAKRKVNFNTRIVNFTCS